jgi:uncharacterized integral membrane protein
VKGLSHSVIPQVLLVQGAIMNNTKSIVMAIMALLVLVVVIQNTTTVETKILFFSLTAPLAVMLFSVLLIGFVLGVLAGMRGSSKKK